MYHYQTTQVGQKNLCSTTLAVKTPTYIQKIQWIKGLLQWAALTHPSRCIGRGPHLHGEWVTLVLQQRSFAAQPHVEVGGVRSEAEVLTKGKQTEGPREEKGNKSSSTVQKPKVLHTQKHKLVRHVYISNNVILQWNGYVGYCLGTAQRKFYFVRLSC